MLRLSAIFIAVCVVLISASLGAMVYLIFGLSGWESAIVGLAALTALGLINAVSTRLRDRSDVATQITDLSRGMADLARQVAEIARRTSAAEIELGSVERRSRAMAQPLAGEISEIGSLIKQLAETASAHEAAIAALKEGRIAAPQEAEPGSEAETEADTAASEAIASEDLPEESAPTTVTPFRAATLAPKPDAPAAQNGSAHVATTGYFKGKSRDEIAAFIRAALETNRVELHLQPILTLPQRKVRYYEALVRLRAESGDLVSPPDFLAHAESAGLMPKIDNLMLFRCVQALRRLLTKNRELGLFCNIATATLTDSEIFPQFFQFMDANRAIASSLMLELPQEAFRTMGPLEQEALSALGERGYRFSMDHVTDLRMEPRDLSERGIRFVKVPAAALLNRANAPADIHAADLSDLLGRFGISLIAERIETEAAVVDLLDYDVRFGQGLLFSPPRPVRADAMQGGGNSEVLVRDAAPSVPASAAI
jgi:cyclic-di-GMP phosphodiesterase TipF (flagellum assembly factor)